jgi:2-succinyl-6-hydroxy-2,4-cyclohexadiene-1-carboxylate synthase
MSLIAVNGLHFNVEETGDGPPLLLLHGFTGSIRSWGAHTPVLASVQRVIAVDLIGHGQSDAPEDWRRYSMEHCVADLLALLDILDVADFDLLGYSMGGRVALQLAAAAPERIKRLIVESGSPGLEDAAEREARIAADEQLAQTIEGDGLEAFVDLWERLPLFASQVRLPADVRARVRAQRLASEPRGLANSLRGMGTGRQTSLWERLTSLQMPALLLAGALDAKYCELARQMATRLPHAAVRTIAEVGHTTHLEQPDAFQQAVLNFLNSGRQRRWQLSEA